MFKRMTESEYKNLGTMNMWKETPEEVEKCREENHTLQEVNLGTCWNEYYCEICHIRYTIDSSD